MKQITYHPENPTTEGERYPSYYLYKKNRGDEFIDAFGNERLPNYHVSSEESFYVVI
jgi:hypothetical protein